MSASGSVRGGDSSDQAWRQWISGLSSDDIVTVTELVETGLGVAASATQGATGWTLDKASIDHLQEIYDLEVLRDYVGPVARVTAFRGNDLPRPRPHTHPLFPSEVRDIANLAFLHWR